VHKVIKDIFPKVSCTVIDSHTQTEHEVQKLIHHFTELKSPSIMLATPSSLAYEWDSTVTILISVEGLLASPSYSADEDAFRTYMYIRERTTEHLIIQTMFPKDHYFIAHIQSGEVTQFLRTEAELRERLKLPPTTIHILLSIKGRRDDVIEDVRTMLTLLAELKPRAFSELVRLSPTTYSHTTIVRLPVKSWPQEHIAALLASVHPAFDIKILT
jgi:primosomal protein N'